MTHETIVSEVVEDIAHAQDYLDDSNASEVIIGAYDLRDREIIKTALIGLGFYEVGSYFMRELRSNTINIQF